MIHKTIQVIPFKVKSFPPKMGCNAKLIEKKWDDIPIKLPSPFEGSYISAYFVLLVLLNALHLFPFALQGILHFSFHHTKIPERIGGLDRQISS